jgi:hypothetical protein
MPPGPIFEIEVVNPLLQTVPNASDEPLDVRLVRAEDLHVIPLVGCASDLLHFRDDPRRRAPESVLEPMVSPSAPTRSSGGGGSGSVGSPVATATRRSKQRSQGPSPSSAMRPGWVSQSTQRTRGGSDLDTAQAYKGQRARSGNQPTSRQRISATLLMVMQHGAALPRTADGGRAALVEATWAQRSVRRGTFRYVGATSVYSERRLTRALRQSSVAGC